MTADGAMLLVVNPDSGSLTIVDTRGPSVTAELAVGEDPRTVAVADATSRAYVANRSSGTVSVVDLDLAEVAAEVAVGDRPYGVVTSLDGSRVYVALQGEDRVLALDGADLETIADHRVAARPSGLAISPDGSKLYVTHLLSGVLTVVDLETWSSAEIPLWPDSNLLQSIVLSPTGDVGYIPHTRSNTSNRALTFDTTVFPLVSLVDLVAEQHLVGRQIALEAVDPPGVGLPFDAALSADGSILWVVNAASNDLTAVDLETRQRVAHVEVGDNPRGVVVAPDGSRLYVNNTLAGTVSVIDTTTFTVTSQIEVTEIPLPPAMLLGKRLFHSSDDPRLARAQWIACATCHIDGEHDGRTWEFGFAGPRNTTSLHGMVQTYPLRWSAEWNESADSEFAVTREQFGGGLLEGDMHEPLAEPNTGRSYELDCLAAFQDSLAMTNSRYPGALDGDAVAGGEAVFNDPVVGCAGCHPRPFYTDLESHDVGTADGPRERLGPEIDTPTLRNLWRSAPYLHDGGADDLHAVLTTGNPEDRHGVTAHLTQEQLGDLEVFLLSLPANNDACLSCGEETVGKDGCAGQRGGVMVTNRPSDARTRRPSGRHSDRTTVTGRVVTATTGRPVPQAVVSVRATSHRCSSDGDGRFSITLPATSEELEIAAWAPGYYIASLKTSAPAAELELVLRRHHSSDNPQYEWLDPTPNSEVESACGNCHPTIVTQWQGNAHGGSISNPRFYSFYNGTDIDGIETVSPGYLLDFPGTTGNCATCHAPGAAVDAPFATDMNAQRGTLTAGIHCDFCHKIGGAYLKAARRSSVRCAGCHKRLAELAPAETPEPYPNMPGVLSLRLLRPPEGEQIFIGPYPDIHDPDTYSPLMDSSAFCAPCHQFSFWGTPIYTSYGEWLASPYSDPENGRTCQDCHMPPTGDTHFALPDQGGLAHDPTTIPSHLQVGAGDRELLENTIDLDVNATVEGGHLQVNVTVTNTGAGHHVPTDHPGRHLLLVVSAEDGAGQPLTLLDGPTVPDWGGDRAGEPGTGFAKVLRDVRSGEEPVVSYWKQAIISSDTRLPAFATDTTSYTFDDDRATVRVQVIFRRVYQSIAERYGWDLGEVVMEERVVRVD